MTRGIDCNNPMNLMMTDIPWHGEIRPSHDYQQRLCTFDKMESGIRAGAKTLLAYYNIHNLTTVSEIIARYAPPVENDTGAYVKAVCDKLGAQPDENIDLGDFQTLWLLVSAIIHQEQGSDCCNSDQIQSGIQEALS